MFPLSGKACQACRNAAVPTLPLSCVTAGQLSKRLCYCKPPLTFPQETFEKTELTRARHGTSLLSHVVNNAINKGIKHKDLIIKTCPS